LDGGRIQLDPPLTDVAWSDAFAGRSLETFFIFLRDGSPRVLRPIHAASLLLGWGPKSQPGTVVVDAAARYELQPLVVHSTSWRVVDDRLILTYVAVVEPPARPSPHLVEQPVFRTELARGAALAAPTQIAVNAARSVLGAPYVWGAAGPDAFDCSGLTSWAWAQAGVVIPHSAAAQYAVLPHVPLSDVQPGDVIYYGNFGPHVALYVGGGMIIHARHPGIGGQVQEDSMYGYDTPYGAVRPG